jgi:hypothetical protein
LKSEEETLRVREWAIEDQIEVPHFLFARVLPESRLLLIGSHAGIEEEVRHQLSQRGDIARRCGCLSTPTFELRVETLLEILDSVLHEVIATPIQQRVDDITDLAFY